MSAHKLFRLAASLYNSPQLIIPAEFEKILAYVDSRNFDMMIPSSKMEDGEEDSEDDPTSIEDMIENGICVITVEGTLTAAPVQSLCGTVGTSYAQLEESVEEAIEAGVDMIVMTFSSGGGQAARLFESTNNIRSMIDAAGIPLYGYVLDGSLSASFAISCICDELYCNPSAEVGSVGCVVALTDTSKAMEQEGVKRIYLTSGTEKVPFAEDGSFKQSFLDDVQAQVDKLGTQFINHVSQYTGIDSKIIRGFEAASFDADEALERDLITGIKTQREFVDYIVNKKNGANNA